MAAVSYGAKGQAQRGMRGAPGVPDPWPLPGQVPPVVPQAATAQAATAATQPTFQPAAAPNPQIAQLQNALLQQDTIPDVGIDPRIAEIENRLRQPVNLPSSPENAKVQETIARIQAQLQAPSAIKAPDFSGQQAQATNLRGLIDALSRGEGVTPITNIGADPEAAAYRVAKRRNAERLREHEANRAAASSGVSGSGEFDVRLRGIEEATGEDIAGFEAGLAGRRRGEAITAATQGANLSLADLDRQSRDERARYESAVGAEQSRRGGELALLQAMMAQSGGAQDQAYRSAQMGREADLALLGTARGEQSERRGIAERGRESQQSSRRALLDTLLAQQAEESNARERANAVSRQAESRRLEEELLRQSVEENRRRMAASVPGGRSQVGGVSEGWGAFG